MKLIRANFKAKLLVASPPIEGEIPLNNAEQAFSGKSTALTPAQMRGDGRPALFKKTISWPTGGRVFDIGAGHVKMVELLKNWFLGQSITYLPWDKFNGGTYNGYTETELRKQKADVATASNLLNVIPDLESRMDVIRQMYNALRPGGHIYISVHRESGKQPGQSGKDKWQNHKVPKGYLEEVQQVFPDAVVKDDLITGTKGGIKKAGLSTPKDATMGSGGVGMQKNAAGYSRLMRILKGTVPMVSTFGIISAENPQNKNLSPEENNKLMEKMKEVLRNSFFGYIQHQGHYGTFEKPFFIMNLPRTKLLELAQRFDQESVIFGSVEHATQTVTFEFIQDGYVLSTRTLVVSNVDGKEEMYSEYKGRKFRIPFFDDSTSSVVASNLPKGEPSLMPDEVSDPENAPYLSRLVKGSKNLEQYARGALHQGLAIYGTVGSTMQALRNLKVR